jgi:hypothetical protein
MGEDLDKQNLRKAPSVVCSLVRGWLAASLRGWKHLLVNCEPFQARLNIVVKVTSTYAHAKTLRRLCASPCGPQPIEEHAGLQTTRAPRPPGHGGGGAQQQGLHSSSNMHREQPQSIPQQSLKANSGIPTASPSSDPAVPNAGEPHRSEKPRLWANSSCERLSRRQRRRGGAQETGSTCPLAGRYLRCSPARSR